MTKEEVFAMAHKAWGDHHEIFWFDDDGIEKFAEIVAAYEREACAKVCDEYDMQTWADYGEYSSGYGDEIRKRNKL